MKYLLFLLLLFSCSTVKNVDTARIIVVSGSYFVKHGDHLKVVDNKISIHFSFIGDDVKGLYPKFRFIEEDGPIRLVMYPLRKELVANSNYLAVFTFKGKGRVTLLLWWDGRKAQGERIIVYIDNY